MIYLCWLFFKQRSIIKPNLIFSFKVMKLKLLIVALFCSVVGWGQTNPTAFDLSTGSWTLTGWNSSVPASSYPGNGAIGSDITTGVVAGVGSGNMMFWKNGAGDAAIATAENANITSNYTAGSGKVVGNGTSGFYFDNTGGAGIGSAVLAINTTNRTAVQVAWTGRTIAVGPRQYGIRLQYRVGTSGAWTDANGTVTNILYTGGTAGSSQVMPVITLPTVVENQAVVQLLWRFYYIGPTTGVRPQFGVDEINVTSSPASSNTITTDTAITGSPFCVSASTGASVSVPFTSVGTFNAGNVYTAQLSNASGVFPGTTIGTLSASGVDPSGTISATIPAGTAAGTGYRIRVVSSNPVVAGTNNTVDLTVQVPAAITTQPSTTVQNLCQGSAATALSVAATGTTLTYQWYSNTTATTSGGTPVGTSSASYTPVTTATGTLYYYCVVSAACGVSVTSNVSGAVNVTAVPSAPSGTINISANPSCGAATLTYSAPSANIYWQTVSGGTSTTFPTTSAFTSLATAGTYTRYVRELNGICWSPEISITFTVVAPVNITTQPVNQSIGDGSNTNFSVTATGSSLTYQWQVDTGGGFVNLINGAPYSNVTTATMTITGATLGMNGYLYRCIVSGAAPCGSVTSNSATLTVNSVPEINVLSGGTNINDNDLSSAIGDNTDFGSTDISTGTIIKTFTIENLGLGVLNLTGTPLVAISGTHAADFTLTVIPSTPIASSGSTTFQITFNPSAVGIRDAVLTIANNDSNENPYNFSIQGRGTTREINVTGNAIDIVDGDITPSLTDNTDFGAVNITSGTIVKTFTIQNTSFSPNGGILSLTDPSPYVVISGPDAADFSLTAMPSSPIAVSGSTTFQITFNPTTAGIKNASISIANDDSNENPYNFDIRGTGTDTEVSFSIVSATIEEDGIEYIVQVQSTIMGSHSADIVVSGGTASNGLQFTFTPITATFTTSTTFTTSVFINDNITCDGNINVIFGLNNNVSCQIGTNNTLQLNILDDELVNSTIKSLSFEITDDWSFTSTGTGAANTTANKYFGTKSYRMDGAGSLTTDNISLVGFSDVTLSVAFASTGVDSDDDLFLDISYDNGATWIGTGSIKLVDGFSNAGINIGNTNASNPTTVSSNPWLVNIPTGETQIRVRLRAEGISTGEYYFVDDIVLRGSQCVIPCVPTHTITSVTPSSGPVGTEVTINGTGLTGTTVSFSGINATILSNTGTQLIAVIPAGATTGVLSVNDAQPCSVDTAYTIINSENSSCEGIATTTDLIIYDIHDEYNLSGGFITIYNGTAATVDMTNYSIWRAGNYGGGYSDYANLTGTIAPGTLGILKVTVGSCGPASTNGTIDNGFNENDGIQLRNADGSVIIDDVHTYVTSKGYYMVRNTGALTARTTYVAADWSIIPLGPGECYPTAGLVVPSSRVTPSVTTQPTYTPSCSATSVILTTAGTEGFVGGNALAYQWYFAAPGSATWTAVTDGGIYSGATTASLSISSIAGVINYQYYCQIRENSATCYTASNAVKITDTGATIWNGTTWSNGTPDLSKLAIINGNYDTTTHGDFECCSLLVNATFTLNIQADDYVLIQNDLTVNGILNVLNNGSLVQVNDLGVNTGNVVYQRTAMARNLDYVYWSSPIATFNVNNLPNNYRYIWNTTIVNTNGGQGNWVAASGNMVAGKGYIARASNGSATPVATTTTFVGVPNNGVINMPIVRGSLEGLDYAGTNGITITRFSDNWNLVGNPYPSAINVDEFLDLNTNIEGAVRIWTHGNLPSTSINNPFYGSYQANYTPDDYITHNGVGTVSGPVGFNGFMAGGQGFLINMLDGPAGTGNLVFNNSLRNRNYNNSQFYRTSNVENVSTNEKNRIWLDLINNANNGAKRTLIGYISNATYDKDRLYDAVTSVATTMHLYSIIGDDKMTIQGRQLPFDPQDRVKLGYFIPTAGNYSIAIATVDGLFLNGQNIYLEDKQLGIIHDLRQSPYSFAATSGIVNDRFVLRYTNETLGNEDFENDSNVVISSSDVIAIHAINETIQSVQIHNVLGQLLINEKNVSSEIFEINTLQKNKAPLVIQVTLENGNKVTKKLIY